MLIGLFMIYIQTAYTNNLVFIGYDENPAVFDYEPTKIEAISSIYLKADKDLMNCAEEIRDLADKVDKMEEAASKENPVNLDTFSAFAQTVKSLSDLEKNPVSISLQGNILNLQIPFLKREKRRWALLIEPTYKAEATCKIDLTNIGFGSTVRLDKLISSYSVSTATPTGLEESAEKLKRVLENLQDELENIGIDFGTYTVQDIANALINVAVNPENYNAPEDWKALTEDEIEAAVNKICDAESALEIILRNATSTNTMQNNKTKVNLVGILSPRISLLYSHDIERFKNINLKGLTIGYALRLYPAQIFYDEIEIIEGEEDFDIQKATKFSLGWGIDAGVAYKKKILKGKIPTQVGLCIYNLIPPKFDTPQTAKDVGIGSIKLYPRVTLQGIIYPHRMLRLSTQVDWNKHKLLFGKERRQNWLLEAEFVPFSGKLFGFRLSTYAVKDISKKSDWLVLGRLDMRLWVLTFQLAGGFSKKVEFLDEKVPTSMAVQTGVGLRF
jgi:hypothetical protein